MCLISYHAISLYLIKHHTMNFYGQIEYSFTPLLMLVLVELQWSASHLGHSVPGERAPDTHWIGD